jgi:hypothetical protein
MNINNAVANRQALVLFNFWLKKQQNDKRIGDLTFADFLEMCEFLAISEASNAANKSTATKQLTTYNKMKGK